MINKNKAIIVDLDETLFSMKDFTDYPVDVNSTDQWKLFGEVNYGIREHAYPQMLKFINNFSHDHVVYFVTAREDIGTNRKRTSKMLDRVADLSFDFHLIMRSSGDYRPSDIVKRDLYREHIKPFYQVTFALDDKEDICAMWQSEGICALMCKMVLK